MDFNELFESLVGQDAELNAIDADAVAAEVAAEKPAKDGLAYVGDFQDANGHAISRYALTIDGTRVFDVIVDNFAEVPVPAKLGKIPAGVTAHAIMLVKPGETGSPLVTNGLAFRAPHPSGIHIEGRALQAYIYPRAVRFLVQLYV